MVRRATLAALLVALAAGPGRADDLDRRAKGDLAIQARNILRTYCVECHGPNHKEAAAHTSFGVLTHKELVNADPARAGLTFVPKDGKGKSHLIELIECGSMPPGGRKRPTDKELDVLKEWATRAGAASYPEAFDDATTLKVMLDDLDARQADAEFLRYLSFAHLVRDDTPLPDLKEAEERLKKSLQNSRRGRGDPEPVDDSATLFRVDIRQFGWHTRDLFQRFEPGQAGGVYPMNPYDVILLDYPFGYTLAKGDGEAGRLKRYLDAAKQVRPVAFVRADWLTDALTVDEPLDVDLASLMELADARDKGAKTLPKGPKVRPFPTCCSLSLPVFPDMRRPILPLGAAHSGDVSTDPAPFKFTAAIAAGGKKPVETLVVNTPFKIEVTSEREVYLLVLNVLPDGEIKVQPLDGGQVLKGGTPRLLRPEGTDDFAISSIDGGKPGATEHFIVFASEFEIKRDSLTIVRSVHPPYDPKKSDSGPIWRIVFKPEAGAVDADKAGSVVRKVLPLKVTRN
jgi:hypothetical protein